MAIQHVSLPHTENGAKLVLTQEQEENLKVVYRKQDDGTATFVGLWDPETEYPDDHIALPIRSTFDKATLWNAGDEFANVLESTGDTVRQSWSELYKANAPNTTWVCHAEKDTIYKQGSPTKIDGFKCTEGSRTKDSSNVCGGHVVKGQENISVETGDSADNIFIVPICKCHNTYNKGCPPDVKGKGYYMKLADTITVLKLTGKIRVLPARFSI